MKNAYESLDFKGIRFDIFLHDNEDSCCRMTWCWRLVPRHCHNLEYENM